MLEDTINLAAMQLETKEEKQHRKTCPHIHKQQQQQQQQQQQHHVKEPTTSHHHQHLRSSECHNCSRLRTEMEVGKSSPMIRSPIPDRKLSRREAVAERNDTERKLVKECVKVAARTNNLNDFKLI